VRVAGADVWKGKWVVVILDGGRFSRSFVATSISEAVAELADCVAIGVDMPIGLPAGGASRPADSEARIYVGPRRSSVFSTPAAELVDCRSVAEANALAKSNGWPGISAQAFSLKKQILAVQPLAEADERIWEVHPEVSFAEANGGIPLEWSKISWNGAALRLRILESKGVTVPQDRGPTGAAEIADVLDAAIAAWSADRIAHGTALSFPPNHRRIGAIWR
jgi:predicted RNase H-like nuclease